MTSKDASDGKTRSVRTFLSIAGGAAVLLGVSLAARMLLGPGSATAQAPVRQASPARTAPAPVTRSSGATAVVASDSQAQPAPKIMPSSTASRSPKKRSPASA